MFFDAPTASSSCSDSADLKADAGVLASAPGSDRTCRQGGLLKYMHTGEYHIQPDVHLATLHGGDGRRLASLPRVRRPGQLTGRSDPRSAEAQPPIAAIPIEKIEPISAFTPASTAP